MFITRLCSLEQISTLRGELTCLIVDKSTRKVLFSEYSIDEVLELLKYLLKDKVKREIY